MQIGQESVAMDAATKRALPAARLRTAFWLAWTVLLALKVWLGMTLAPFGDEAFYWQESRDLDWSYSDLPAATAFLIRASETVFGHGTLAMRAPFLLLGALLPLLLVRLGIRLFGAARGWAAGLLCLALPLLNVSGVLALPEVPLLVCSVLALDAFERAADTQRRRDWTLLGLALAGAWLCHYRAVLLFAVGLAFLILTARGRRLWRTSGLWLALALSLLGLLPTLVFNVEHDWAALSFQLVERHPWQFHADALVQPIEQALVCTPLFYLLLLWAAWRSLRQMRCGAPWDLFALCAVIPIVVYFAIGCFADDTRFRVHWPLLGYLPLLVALPALLWGGGTESNVAQQPVRAAPRPWLVLTLATLGLGCAATFAYLALAAIPGGAIVLARWKAFPEHFTGWREAAAMTRELLERPEIVGNAIVADNFMLAAELDFALAGTHPVYSLNGPLNAKHGRTAQLALWKRDEDALRALGPADVLLVVEPTARRERERAAWLASICTRVTHVHPLIALDLYEGRKRFRFLRASIDPQQTAMSVDSATNCIPDR